MKVVIHTLGCKVNQYESDGLACALENLGYDVSQKLEKADIYIVNTCAVTNEAEKKSRQTVAKLRSKNPNAKIIITGCASEHNANQFANLKNVTYVCGTKNKLALLENLDKQAVEVLEHNMTYDEGYTQKASKVRAYVKIQDGCNNFCSYCLIPYLRGRSRSRNMFDVLQEVSALEKDAKEIVLTGINITDYKIDGEKALGKLLAELSSYPVRIRLGSIEETLIDNDFIDIAKNMQNLCPHFHLSLQSGCAKTLKKMNRHYTPEDFDASVKLLRKNFSNPFISTDIIVGFPGETEEDFLESYNFAKKQKFAFLHIFPYSKREGTGASKMPQVPTDIKTKRAQKLEELNKCLQKKYIKSCKHKTLQLLVEEVLPDGYAVGHTENYIKCYLKVGKKYIAPNDLIYVKIKKSYLDGALCLQKGRAKK